MEKEKLTYRAFAKITGVSASTICHFLSGKSRSLSIPIIQKIVKGTKGKITLEDIVDETIH